MKSAMAEHDDSFGGRARDSVTGWWGRSRRFLSEVRNEMGRVTWPSRREEINHSIVVIVTVVIVGLFTFVVDLSLNVFRQWLFKLIS